MANKKPKTAGNKGMKKHIDRFFIRMKEKKKRSK
jgi:hypothetical protein